MSKTPNERTLADHDMEAALTTRPALSGPAAPEQTPTNPPNLADAAEMLWVVLANVSGSDWSKQTQEWQDAAARWRDYYFDSRPVIASTSSATSACASCAYHQERRQAAEDAHRVMFDEVRDALGLMAGGIGLTFGQEISALRARLVMAEQHKALSLLGKSSYQEVVEDKLREALAEAQVRADAIEMKYRAVLWLGHGHTGLYGDDGEMQCGQCAPYGAWDYKRAPLEKLEEVAMLAKMKPDPPVEP